MDSNDIRSVAQTIAQNLNTIGSKAAIVIEGQTYTYADLKKMVSPLAIELNNKTRTDDRIGLHLQNNIKCYAGLIAILVSGRTYVPINEGFGLAQCQYIIHAASVKAIIRSNETAFIKDLLEKENIHSIEIIDENDDNITANESSFAYLLFTSGSTGDPKGVPISHSNLDHFIHGITSCDDWTFKYDDKFIQPFNLSFDLFVFTTFLPLFIGATLVSVPLQKISLHAAMLLETEKISVSLFLPSHMMLINKVTHGKTYDQLRLSFFCGEALYASDLKQWQQRSPNAKQINIYGPTEATVAFSKYIWSEDSEEQCLNDIVPIGKPFGHNKMALLPLDNDEKELLLAGPQVFENYLKPKNNTFVTLKNEKYYRTGDICERNENGDYLFKGRNDGQVKIGGHRIELADVENKIKKVLPERHVIAIKKVHEDNLTSIHVFIIGQEIVGIQEKLDRSLPNYMRPTSIRFIDEFPTNLNGKIDRKKLKAQI
ncbi:MAG: AMP-binding protein [Flavobacteriales bacterium]|nr:AMP-binding protein [Flavobacteriales bacterium]